MGYTAIMTEKDRQRIKGESGDPDDKRYQSATRIRQRIAELKQDAEILEKHHPELHEELQDAVCAD